ncbi:MAG: hypothetical protein ACKVX7_16130 [Planctomycetota bacterium]
MSSQRTRERGSALICFLLCLVLLLALSAGASSLGVIEQRAGAESRDHLTAFYLADSGAQLGNFKVRASNGTLGATTFDEPLGVGSAHVVIAPVSATVYSITSSATSGVMSETIQMHLELTANFDMEGAIQINVDPSVTIDDDELLLSVRAATSISGADHDASGALLADQSQATYGVALSPIPGYVDVDVVVDISGGASLAGTPAQTANDVAGQTEVFNDLLTYARSNADIAVTGAASWDNTEIGSYGTAADPQLIYVNLGDNHTLTMRQNFVGHGTLVIESSNQTTVEALHMEDSTFWHGLVIVHFTGNAEVPGSQLVGMYNYATIIGGLSITLAGAGSTVTGSGDIFAGRTGNAAVKYSSAALAAAEGISQVIDYSARVISYQRVGN